MSVEDVPQTDEESSQAGPQDDLRQSSEAKPPSDRAPTRRRRVRYKYADVTSHAPPTADPVAAESSEEQPRRAGTKSALWRRRPSRWSAQVGGMALVVALLVAVSVMLFKSPQPAEKLAQRDAVIAAVEQVALGLSTIGASNAAQHIDSLTNQSTGEFRNQLGAYARIFQGVLQAGNVSSEAKVTAAAIERIDPDSANALVTVAATVTNSQVSTGQLRNYRLAMQLQRDDNRWLVSKVEYVQ
ncbi:MAG TPA: hypothetical protein VHZ96_01505 [Frankiaceae bacterium]|jgi:Mce-associated membrane protein|nr:hypothetical protein [Frankiaceae bacterium]